MEETTMTKDREVEVCTEEEGFEGAWLGAVLEEDPTGRTEVRVRYTTLLTNDGLSPLTEIIDPKLIRPVPPENLYSGVVLEEGMVVDAYDRDAWWTGLVMKKKENDNYLVSFESPPDILQYERNHLRAHLQWTGSKWVRPVIQELDKSMFCSGTMVEVRSPDEKEIQWFPAMIVVKVGEKQSIVKYCNKHWRNYNDEVAGTIRTVNTSRVRPTPPPSSVEEYGLVERVEVFHRLAWRRGTVSRVLSHRHYRVKLDATKKEFVFKHSDLRLIKVWEDGVWRNGARCRQNPVKETLDNAIESKPTRSSSGAKPGTSGTTRKQMKMSSLKDNGETVTESETVAVTGEVGKKRVTPVTPSVSLVAAEAARSKTAGKKEKLPIETADQSRDDKRAADKSRKRKREEKQHSDLKETDKTCNGSNADDDIDDQPLSTWIRNLSTGLEIFEKKKSPQFCKTLESLKSRPLPEVKVLERAAVGMMAGYNGLLEEFKALKPDDSTSTFNRFNVSFAELEKHGFDVADPQSRIRKVLPLKDGLAKEAEERICVQNKFEEAEREIAELKREILELQRRKAIADEKKEAAEKLMVEMKSNAETTKQKMQEIVSAPW